MLLFIYFKGKIWISQRWFAGRAKISEDRKVQVNKKDSPPPNTVFNIVLGKNLAFWELKRVFECL